MKKLKIVFFGTSDRSVPILEVINKEFSLVLCVTKSDTKVGRSQNLHQTAVKKWALKNSVRHLEIRSLKDYDLKMVAESLHRHKPDYGVVADFSFMIPEEIINFFDRKLINIHFSLLPKYRGASPVQFAILNGDDMTGVTYQLVSKRMDSGDILSQIGYKMNGTETSEDLYETLFSVAADKLPEVISGYETGSIKPIPQDEDKATYTYSRTHPHHTFIYKEDALINWKNDAVNIDRKIRAFTPWPIAWTYLKELQDSNCLLPGKIKLKDHINPELTARILMAHIEGNKLSIDALQIEGKNVMTWDDFKNGYLN